MKRTFSDSSIESDFRIIDSSIDEERFFSSSAIEAFSLRAVHESNASASNTTFKSRPLSFSQAFEVCRSQHHTIGLRRLCFELFRLGHCSGLHICSILHIVVSFIPILRFTYTNLNTINYIEGKVDKKINYFCSKITKG